MKTKIPSVHTSPTSLPQRMTFRVLRWTSSCCSSSASRRSSASWAARSSCRIRRASRSMRSRRFSASGTAATWAQ